jgi:hypothetical protein
LGDTIIPAKLPYFFSPSIAIISTLVNLRSLNLSYVNCSIWFSVDAQLTSLVALTLISINLRIDNEPSTPLSVSIILMKLLFFSSLLKRVTLRMFNYPPDTTFIDPSRAMKASSIEYLYLDNIGIDLKSLFAVTPSLHSFTSTVDNNQFFKNIYQHPSVNLQQLSLTFDGTTLYKTERLLSSMTYLTHFTLIGDNVHEDMANGDRLAQLLNKITTFKFKFTFRKNAFILKPLDFHLFETSFWLVEKKWYVTHDWCIDTQYSLLYSNPYCLNSYPFENMIGKFVTESTGPKLTSFPHIKHVNIHEPVLVNNTLWRRCTHVNDLQVTARNFNRNPSWRYAITYLDSTIITCLTIDTCEIETPIDASIQLMHGLPYLRSLCVSLAILRLMLAHNWPHIVLLNIIWGSDPLPRLLGPSEIDLFCRSFTHVERLEICRLFIDDFSQLLNSMMMTLSYVVIEHYSLITADDVRFISYEWLEQNTKLCNFNYYCDKKDNAHTWI